MFHTPIDKPILMAVCVRSEGDRSYAKGGEAETGTLVCLLEVGSVFMVGSKPLLSVKVLPLSNELLGAVFPSLKNSDQLAVAWCR